MLAMSDVSIEKYIFLFSDMGISVAFLVPTPTGYAKSIMDATGPVRTLLKEEKIHDYQNQKQGQEAKKMVGSYFVTSDGLIETEASLYRPVTKQGDPRIWFKNLRKYCYPCNLLSICVFKNSIYVINLSDESINSSIENKGFVFELFQQIRSSRQAIAAELLSKLKEIHNRGFLPSVTIGDPGVGDTLENALGIRRNNSKLPDYKGIELKATRTTRHGLSRNKTRSTLFSRVPDEGLSYREIVETYGKWQIPRGASKPRVQLYETFSTQRVNSYGLLLEMNTNEDTLEMRFAQNERVHKYVSAWHMNHLREALLMKHHETFWVKALSEDRDGTEYFRYDEVIHTKAPNVSLLVPLLEAGIITVDLAAHFKENGMWRDHGALFKIKPDHIGLLLTSPVKYDLSECNNK